MIETQEQQDARYLKILLDPVRVCLGYTPKMGHGKDGITLAEFKAAYGADVFYNWMGLDSPLLYAAHRAAGGMTSLYRQIGIGCEKLTRQLLVDYLDLGVADSAWAYQVSKAGGGMRTLTLDGRIPLDKLSGAKAERAKAWLTTASKVAGVSDEIASVLKGAVFEVRQGYKSKDSKRQNADIANAATAYSQGYLPVLVLMSHQIDDDIALRYENANWLLLRGVVGGTSTNSTYEFYKQVVGFDMEAFFRRHAPMLRAEVEAVLKKLLEDN